MSVHYCLNWIKTPAHHYNMYDAHNFERLGQHGITSYAAVSMYLPDNHVGH